MVETSRLAKDFCIDRMELNRFIRKEKRQGPATSTGYEYLSNLKRVFNERQEIDFASHIKALCDQYYGLSITKCRCLADEFAKKNNIKMPDNWVRDEKAGREWIMSFKSRHGLAIRQPEVTSLAQLRVQLQLLGANFDVVTVDGAMNILHVKEYFLSLSHDQQLLMSQVVALLQLILVIPATNATSERSFSALRRLKSYLRTTMLQERLNYLMSLHVHKDRTDALNMQTPFNEFIGDSEHRCSIFAKYANE